MNGYGLVEEANGRRDSCNMYIFLGLRGSQRDLISLEPISLHNDILQIGLIIVMLREYCDWSQEPDNEGEEAHQVVSK
jgi:hypothetical protein